MDTPDIESKVTQYPAQQSSAGDASTRDTPYLRAVGMLARQRKITLDRAALVYHHLPIEARELLLEKSVKPAFGRKAKPTA